MVKNRILVIIRMSANYRLHVTDLKAEYLICQDYFGTPSLVISSKVRLPVCTLSHGSHVLVGRGDHECEATASALIKLTNDARECANGDQ